MKKKCRLLQNIKGSMGLIVSIPGNKPEFALAARKGGADGIKVHLNVSHFASGVDFGSWEEEKDNICKILEQVDIPVGLLPGAQVLADKTEVVTARDMGIDFLDAFAHFMPVELYSIPGLGRMTAVNGSYSKSQIRFLEKLDTDLIEATLLDQSEYGKELSIRDLLLYNELVSSTNLPVYVPTQKKIKPRELEYLKKAGAGGIVIGAVVTGKNAADVEKTTAEFRRAIEEL